jgi:hypothetical protein
MGMPHRRIRRGEGWVAAMSSRGVLVHCPGGLSAAVSVLAAEIPCGDGMFTKRALEHRKTVHRFDGVMSHAFNSIRLSEDASERKSPSQRAIAIQPVKQSPGARPSCAGSYSIKYGLDFADVA